MDDKERERALLNERLLWLMGFALLWELLGRPLLMKAFPDVDLPPSLLREVLSMASSLSGLPF